MNDRVGNRIIKRKKKKGWYYYLILASERFHRTLGYMDNDWLFHITRHPYEHYYYAIDWFGFNSQLIHDILEPKQPISFELKITGEKFLLRPDRILTNEKKYLNFVDKWFELQMFVQFEKIKENYMTDWMDIQKFIQERKEEEIEEKEVKVDKELDWQKLAKEL